MKQKYYRQAESLAQRHYQAHVFLDETTDGEPVYVAIVPEMPGCIAHGDSIEEALEWLESAKLDHIWFLLDRELDVPSPRMIDKSVVVVKLPRYADENANSALVVSDSLVSAAPT